jgi:toxin-antitoxin system PIN domain toxin
MDLVDVNVLVYAYSRQAPRHEEYRSWLVQALEGPAAFGYSELALSGFLRVVTHPKVFDPPSALDQALSFCEVLRSRPNAVRVAPGDRHWGIFVTLCNGGAVKGNLVPDAYHAALAIESGNLWVTTDRGFARFPGLRWRHPLD